MNRQRLGAFSHPARLGKGFVMESGAIADVNSEADFDERLARLERDHQIGKWACIGLLFAIGAVLVEGLRWQPKSGRRSIETEQVVIRDHDGRMRGRMGVDSYGEVSFELMGREGLSLVDLHSNRDGSTIFSLSSKGKMQTTLATIADGSAFLNLYDENQANAKSWSYHSPETLHERSAEPVESPRAISKPGSTTCNDPRPEAPETKSRLPKNSESLHASSTRIIGGRR